MFRNRFSGQAIRLNKQFISGLNKLGVQSAKLQALKKEYQQNKQTTNNDGNDEIKTNDQSQTTLNGNTPSREYVEDFEQLRNDPLYQYAKFRAFITQRLPMKESNILQKQQKNKGNNYRQRFALVKKSQQIINIAFQKQNNFINNVHNKRINRKVKSFYVYKVLVNTVKQIIKGEKQYAEMLLICKQILKQVITEVFILKDQKWLRQIKNEIANQLKVSECQNQRELSNLEVD